MTPNNRPADMARLWIESWIRMDIDWLRENLAEDFVHISPFGRLEGRDHYLATVEPMARKSVMKLEIKAVIAEGQQAAIWFENHTPNGVVESCDWVHVDNGVIRSIQSFYDSTLIRGVLSSDEQKNLGDE